MNYRFKWFLEYNRFIANQFGFRIGHSTIFHLLFKNIYKKHYH